MKCDEDGSMIHLKTLQVIWNIIAFPVNLISDYECIGTEMIRCLGIHVKYSYVRRGRNSNLLCATNEEVFT